NVGLQDHARLLPDDLVPKPVLAGSLRNIVGSLPSAVAPSHSQLEYPNGRTRARALPNRTRFARYAAAKFSSVAPHAERLVLPESAASGRSPGKARSHH